MQDSGESQSRPNVFVTSLLTRMFDARGDPTMRLQALKELKEHIMEADVEGTTIKDAHDLTNKVVEEMERLQTRLPSALLEKYQAQWESLPERTTDLNTLVAQFEAGLNNIERTIKLTVCSEDWQDCHS